MVSFLDVKHKAYFLFKHFTNTFLKLLFDWLVFVYFSWFLIMMMLMKMLYGCDLNANIHVVVDDVEILPFRLVVEVFEGPINRLVVPKLVPGVLKVLANVFLQVDCLNIDELIGGQKHHMVLELP